MSERQTSDVAPWVRFVSLGVGLLVLALLILTPLRAWLNRIPNFWAVVYPLLSLFSGYLVISSLRAKEGGLSIAKWGVLCASALCATAYAWGAGRVFFTPARWLAIGYIVTEVLVTIFAAVEENGSPELSR